MLLTATGFTDAYTFLRHGHVFAEAMTGNLALVGIGAAVPSVVAFWRPLVPFAAFLAGAIGVWLARREPPAPQAAIDRPQLLALAMAVAVLVVVGFLPGNFPQTIIVAAIAFTAGMQISAFRHIETATVSTVAMTVNSMRVVFTTLDALASGDPRALAQARDLLTTLAGFLLGAIGGGALSVALHNRAAWPDAGLFALAAALHGARRGRVSAPGRPGDRGG